MVRNRLSPCGPSIGPRTQLQRTQSRSTRPLAKSSTRLLRATRGPLRFILWARTCACMTTYVQVRNLWAGGRAGQKALFPAFQAGHAGSIPVARSSCSPWSGAFVALRILAGGRTHRTTILREVRIPASARSGELRVRAPPRPQHEPLWCGSILQAWVSSTSLRCSAISSPRTPT